MTSELEVIRDAEIVQEDQSDIWEASVSEWSSGASQAVLGSLRQARAAAAVCRVYGTGAMLKFAQEVGTSKSTAYSYAKCWFVYGHLIEDGDGEFSSRLEAGGITMTQLIAATKAENPVGMIEEAEEENLSSRAIEAKIKEEEEPGNVEKIEATYCSHCGADSKFWTRVPEGSVMTL